MENCMKRREFLKSVAALGGILTYDPYEALSLQTAPTAPVPDLAIKRVLVMFKCHFDAGFVNTQAAVVNRYFTEFFPRAIQLADEMRNTGKHPYVWTTGSWLLYEYLEQAAPRDRERMEQAISKGDIAWHALPFSWQTELMDRSMISGATALSGALDRRFGRTTTGAKMTDVPGHTRGLISPLVDSGVKFIDIGVNGASMPAEVPPVFRWKEVGGKELVVMYHHGYGSVATVPNSDLAIAIVVRGDNSGPHKPEEIEKIYSDFGAQFPNARVTATNLTEIANAVEPFRANLPVVTQEIGDTWIYGISSDPLKIARYREIARLRQAWIADGKFRIGDTTDVGLLRRLLLVPEHTWGTDTKTWLDFDNYEPADLARMLHTKNYEVVKHSWEEKRQNLFDGISALPETLQTQARTALRNLDAKKPQLSRSSKEWVGKELETEHFVLRLDAQTGAICRLRNQATGREWATEDYPLALFSYQTLSQQDYARFMSNYIISAVDWAKKDFGKPNIERFGAESRNRMPSLIEARCKEDAEGHRLVARLEVRDSKALESGKAAFPQQMYLELILPRREPVIRLNFSWFQKPATRLPEALWLTFNPVTSGAESWMMDKSGEEISPFEVVPSGGRHLHAVDTGLRYKDGNEVLAIETLDAPLFAFGEKSPLNFSKSQPDLSKGVHCNLFNNAWGTNYLMWYGEDMRFRFTLKC
ncbi:DUF5054 domain-containing protein [Edaphobacter bradus]|uniref:DUF5054 domain-containing protein n=1 Tax=Edaphobacter bradus TaxID=2259016 RepID=UPI0021DF564B|nr:DUF5054 domain-containing protein [Edaphobacter bradus]